MSDVIEIPVAIGELVDKITILEIKNERIADAEKLKNIRLELAMLNERRNRLNETRQMTELAAALKEVNGRIWDLEDVIRDCERRHDFGELFVDTARAIYRTNDERASIKRQINAASGSKIVEEKSYKPY